MPGKSNTVADADAAAVAVASAGVDTVAARWLPRQHPLWHCERSHRCTSSEQERSGRLPQRCMTRPYGLLESKFQQETHVNDG